MNEQSKTPRTDADPDPENDSETCCKMCGDEYALRDGSEPTKYCDLCAHKAADTLELELAEAKRMVPANGEWLLIIEKNLLECQQERDTVHTENERLVAAQKYVREQFVSIGFDDAAPIEQHARSAVALIKQNETLRRQVEELKNECRRIIDYHANNRS